MATEGSRTPNADAAVAEREAGVAAGGERKPFSRLSTMFSRARNKRRDKKAARQESRAAEQERLNEVFSVPDAPTSGDQQTIVDPSHSTMDETSVSTIGQQVVTETYETEKNKLAADLENQARADEFAADVKADADETVGRIDEQSMALEEDADRVQESIANQAEKLDAIPGDIKAEFEGLRAQLNVERDASFERVEGQRAEALSQVMQGKSSAMQAAVQGIQGNINNQIGAIKSNPNLTDAQKAGMVAQVRMSGAGAIAPAIGQTVLGFNSLAANVATTFGQITGQLESTGLQASTGLMGQQGAAYAQAQVAVGEMANQLIEIDASSSAAFAQSQSQLMATRANARMTSNDILLRTLPEQGTPYADFTGSHTAAFEIALGLQDKDFIRQLQVSSMAMNAELFKSMIGTPGRNFWDAIHGGLQGGGVKGALLGGGAALLEGVFGQQGPSA